MIVQLLWVVLAAEPNDCDRHLATLAKQGSEALGAVDGKKLTEAQMFRLNGIAPGRCEKASAEQRACVMGKKVIGEAARCFASEAPLKITSCAKDYSGKCSEARYRDSGDGVFLTTSRRECTELEGTFAEAPCPMADSVGVCTQYGRSVYSAKKFTAATAKKECEGNGGKFEAVKQPR